MVLLAGQGFMGLHGDVSDTQGHLGTRQTTLQVSPHAPATPGEVCAALRDPDLHSGSLRYRKVLPLSQVTGPGSDKTVIET